MDVSGISTPRHAPKATDKDNHPGLIHLIQMHAHPYCSFEDAIVLCHKPQLYLYAIGGVC